jgi:hypothetical protein
VRNGVARVARDAIHHVLYARNAPQYRCGMHRAGWVGVVALLLCAAGCGLQLTTGVSPRAPYLGSLDFGGRLIGTRAAGAYGGGDLVLAATRPSAFSMRSALVTAGYRLVAAHFTLELGAEFGAGQPTTERWGGTGLYLGASPTLLIRVSGNQDSVTGYALASLLWDLVFALRAGIWSRPAGDMRQEIADGAFMIGLRFSAISDVAVSNNRNWEP